MDAEPGYEDMPDGLHTLDGGYLDDYDVRKALYWALFAGAHGHTYGCNPVWQMWRRDVRPLIGVRRPWLEALQLPGAGQVKHARNLLCSRPFLSRIPDQSLIVSDAGAGSYHIRATRDSAGSYALVYLPAGQPVELNLSALAGQQLRGFWYDPRTGVAQAIGPIDKHDRASFVPPGGGPDWVLAIEDESCKFPPPGTGIYPR
jgi:hypothetical protein